MENKSRKHFPNGHGHKSGFFSPPLEIGREGHQQTTPHRYGKHGDNGDSEYKICCSGIVSCSVGCKDNALTKILLSWVQQLALGRSNGGSGAMDVVLGCDDDEWLRGNVL